MIGVDEVIENSVSSPTTSDLQMIKS